MAATRRAPARPRTAVVTFPSPATPALARLLPSGRALALGFALVGLAAAAYGVARYTSIFAVRAVEVRGAPPALAADVREALAPGLGTSLVTVDLSDLGRRATDLPDVAAVRWDRAFPDRLVVTVTPEKPAAVLRQGSGSWLVSRRARVLGPLSRGERPLLPRIWVPGSVQILVGERLADAPVMLALAAILPLPPDFPTRVRSVAATEGGLVLDLITGLDLRLGDGRDIALKLAVAARIVAELTPPAGGGPTYLDVSVPARPVAGIDPQVAGRA